MHREPDGVVAFRAAPKNVEVVHFEYVIFQLRMFDLVFVAKGFEVDPAVTGKATKDLWLCISSIPTGGVDAAEAVPQRAVHQVLGGQGQPAVERGYKDDPVVGRQGQ